MTQEELASLRVPLQHMLTTLEAALAAATPTTALVIDVSGWNNIAPDGFSQAKADGVVGVIAKSTQGTGYTSVQYAVQRKRATNIGLLFGSYHFIDSSDPIQQCDHFLSVAGLNGLLAVDVERNPPAYGESATLEQIEAFITHVEFRTGRFPVLYSSANYLDHFDIKPGSPLLKSPLWLASYRPTPLMPSMFKTWALWQFSSKYPVKGFGEVDASRFAGTVDELRKWWNG